MQILNEKLRIIEQINECYMQGKFEKVILQKMSILDFPIEEEDIFIYEKIIISLFILNDYLGIIELSNKLNNLGYESYIIIYYSLLSFIALTNLYQANLYITSCKILSDATHKLLYAMDGANYSNILSLDNKNSIYAMVMVNFVLGLCREKARNDIDINQEYIFVRTMDLLNTLVELNYPEKIVNKIYKDLKKIYKI